MKTLSSSLKADGRGNYEMVHLCAPLAPPLVTPKYGVARAHENKLPRIMLCIIPV